jgi:hypothetical protein
LRLILTTLYLSLAAGGQVQSLPADNRPQPIVAPQSWASGNDSRSSLNLPGPSSGPDSAEATVPEAPQPHTSADAQAPAQPAPKPKPAPGTPVDKNGDPIPLERRQPQRILGFMPNFRTVSAGAQAHPPGFKYNFIVATHQAFDYSSFIFLGLTSLTAEATNEHPALGKGIEGMGQYTWRGFLDKTDGTYLSAWFLPTLLREDTRFHALGAGHSVFIRSLYVISQQGVARTYSGRKTPNFAGLGGKVLTQVISRNYYPSSATDFGTLATKFSYSVMRDVAFSSVREFYPDIAAHYVRKHDAKEARLAAKRAAARPVAPATPPPTGDSP